MRKSMLTARPQVLGIWSGGTGISSHLWLLCVSCFIVFVIALMIGDNYIRIRRARIYPGIYWQEKPAIMEYESLQATGAAFVPDRFCLFAQRNYLVAAEWEVTSVQMAEGFHRYFVYRHTSFLLWTFVSKYEIPVPPVDVQEYLQGPPYRTSVTARIPDDN